jgi:hypothetical protein
MPIAMGLTTVVSSSRNSLIAPSMFHTVASGGLEYSMTPPGASVTRSSWRRSSMTLVPSYTGDHPYRNARSYKMSRIPGSASYGTRLRSDRCTRKYSSSTPRRKSLGVVIPDIKGTRRFVSSRLLAITSTLQVNSGMGRYTPSGPADHATPTPSH